MIINFFPNDVGAIYLVYCILLKKNHHYFSLKLHLVTYTKGGGGGICFCRKTILVKTCDCKDRYMLKAKHTCLR